MKNRMIIWMAGVLMLCLLPFAANAQIEQEWQSTSAMRQAGSSYSSQITEVGAQSVAGTATTTDEYSPSQKISKKRNSEFGPGRDGGYQDPNSPVGNAWPLAFFAALLGIGIAVKNSIISKKA